MGLFAHPGRGLVRRAADDERTDNAVMNRLWNALGIWRSWFMVYVNHHLMREKLGRYAGLAHGLLLDVGAGDKPYRAFFGVNKYLGANARRPYLPNIPDGVKTNTDVWIDESLPLPFASGSFDSLACFQVLSVIDKPGQFFLELAQDSTSGRNTHPHDRLSLSEMGAERLPASHGRRPA